MQEQTDMQKLATRRLERPRALPPTDTLEDVRKEPCKLPGMASDVTLRSAGLRRRALRSAPARSGSTPNGALCKS